MSFETESLIRAMACVAGFLLLGLAVIPTLRDRERLTAWSSIAAAVIGAMTFYNFGFFRHYDEVGFVNHWEHYHYHLGSKYFPELGYDGLYAASAEAQSESHPGRATGHRIRDLRTNEIAERVSQQSHAREVQSRFTPERWHSFVEDHRMFVEQTPPHFINKIRLDHGYNAPPSWTSVARILTTRISSGPAGSFLLSAVDVVLAIGMFVLVGRTFGARALCSSIALFGLCFGWRYLYVGALIRLDWLAALISAICLLERGRHSLAGALFGYAAAVRLFPALFLAGPAILAIRAWSRGERPHWPLRLFGTFALVLVAGLAVGGLAGRGMNAWPEFLANMSGHWEIHPMTRIGLESLVRTDPIQLWHSLTTPEPLPDLSLTPTSAGGRIVLVVLQIAMLALVAIAAWSATLSEAAILGSAVVFALTPAGSYYWIFLIGLPLAGVGTAPMALIGVSAAIYAHQAWLVDYTMTPTWFALFAWSLALVLVFWLVPRARRTLTTPATD